MATLRGRYNSIRNATRWRLFSYRQRLHERQDRAFDRAHGIATAGDVWLSQAGMDVDSIARGNSVYRPVWEGIFRASMRPLRRVDLSQFYLVDYGSGKGKVLFLAARYPFQRIIGVEYAPLLHQAAQTNIVAFRDAHQLCHSIESINLDAVDYDPPPFPLVCTFFNPFDDATTRNVLTRLWHSIIQTPRPLYLIYWNVRNINEHSAVFTEAPDTSVVAQGRKYLVCRIRQPGRGT